MVRGLELCIMLHGNVTDVDGSRYAAYEDDLILENTARLGSSNGEVSRKWARDTHSPRAW